MDNNFATWRSLLISEGPEESVLSEIVYNLYVYIYDYIYMCVCNIAATSARNIIAACMPSGRPFLLLHAYYWQCPNVHEDQETKCIAKLTHEAKSTTKRIPAQRCATQHSTTHSWMVACSVIATISHPRSNLRPPLTQTTP